MSGNDKTMVLEHIKLQREFHDYVEKNGFSFKEYYAPTPGSFYDNYRRRWRELTHAITPATRNEQQVA